MSTSHHRINPAIAIIVGLLAIIGLVIQPQIDNWILEVIRGYFELEQSISVDLGALEAGQGASIAIAIALTGFKILRIILWMVLVACAVKLAMYSIFATARRANSEAKISSLLQTVVSVAIHIVAFFIIFQSQFPNVELSALFTGSTILGIVVGLALQDTLGNLFAGIAMQADHPFDVGDVVTMSDGRAGVVESITWRAVKIRTFQNRLLVISNSGLGQEIFEVAAKTVPNARLVSFTTEYFYSPAKTIDTVREVVERTENVSSAFRPKVRIKDFADSGIEWEIKYWLEDYALYQDTDALVRQRVWYVFEREGIDFGYPVRRVMMVDKIGSDEAGSDNDKLAEHLGKVVLFSPLTPDETRILAGRVTRKLYSPDEIILLQGDEGGSMFVVLSGEVSIEYTEQGSTKVLRTLSSGDSFGELSVFTGEARSVTVIATEETEVLEISKEAVKELLDVNPKLADAFSEVIRDRRNLLAEASAGTPIGQSPSQERTLDAIKRWFGIKQ